tara:strand:+ start:408 stop:698 length:291 start_codon:yes stop_codon:yes gene_type:complete
MIPTTDEGMPISVGMAADDAKSTPTINAKSSIGNRPIDIADRTTSRVDADAKYDDRKPVDHDSAAPERGEHFAPHRRAMPERAAEVYAMSRRLCVT